MEKKRARQIALLVLKAVGISMGIAVTVLTIMGEFIPQMNTLTGMGIFCLGLAMFINDKEAGK